MGFLDDIENLAKDNSSETDSLVNQAEQYADQQTGGNFDSEIQAGGTQLEDQLGTQSDSNN